LIISAMIAMVGAYVFLLRAHSSKAPEVAVSAPNNNILLQMQLEQLGNGLISLRWNPKSAAFSQARGGRLVIIENDRQPRIITLQAGELKIGHFTYQSSAYIIEFTLEVVDRSGAIAKESALAMLSSINSGQETGTPPQTPQDIPTSGAAAAPQSSQQNVRAFAPPPIPRTTESRGIIDAPPTSPNGPANRPLNGLQGAPGKLQSIPNNGLAVEAPQSSRQNVRAFVPPPIPRTTEQRGIIDAPPTLPNSPVTPQVVDLPTSLKVIAPPPAGERAPQKQFRVESNLQAAKLLKSVPPAYPPFAKLTGIHGTVRFTALIGKDGRIQNLKLITGPPPLADSASAAVKQWIYRPTLLNGEPVEVLTQIDVNFTLEGVAIGAARQFAPPVGAQDKKAEGPNVNVTGCLAQGNGGSDYSIKDLDGKTYGLRAGSELNVKAHLGQKVTITGSPIPDKKEKGKIGKAGEQEHLQMSNFSVVSTTCT
jgi:protein TonB